MPHAGPRPHHQTHRQGDTHGLCDRCRPAADQRRRRRRRPRRRPRRGEIDLDVDSVADPIELPDGKLIYPPKLHGEPIDRIACALLDMQQPSRSRFLRLIGPPGTGKSQIARAIAYRLWTQRGRAIETRHGEPFYGYAEMSGGPSSDEFTFRYEYVPDNDHPGDVRLIPAAFVEAMEHGWVVMIDEVNTIRDVALLSLNGTLDGRLSLYLPAEGRTVTARARASRS